MRTYRLVDQLGTGLMMLRAESMPSYDFMASAQRFVDIRFAAHAARNSMPLVVAPHPEHWARQLPTEVSIYQDFTQNLPVAAREEIGSFAGVSERYGAARARVASLNRYAAKLVYVRLRFGMAWRGLRRP
jgi:hypothetical protein